MLLGSVVAIFSFMFALGLFYPNQASSQTENCDSAYPDFCIASPPPDLNCPDIPDNDFTVLPSDPHGFDLDEDAIGCES